MVDGLLLVALLLGVKHAFDADHLVAVGNILTRAGSVSQATRLSSWWAVGHLVTAGLVTTVLVLGRDTFWPDLLTRLDVLVPAMLILVGLLGLLVAFRRFHVHRHAHGGRAHTHAHVHVNERHEAKKMGAIGLVHGLASNDELLVILVSVLGASTLAVALGYVAVFSLGVVLGMALYAATLQLTVAPTRRPVVDWWTNVALSVISLAYAGWLLAGLPALNVLG